MITETITVRWGGVDVSVEMRRVSGHAREGIIAGEIEITRYRETSCAPVEWWASLGVPGWWPDKDANDFRGEGATPQEALDGLAAQLKQLAEWAMGMVGQHVESSSEEQAGGERS
jgi:hypothetical protein